MSIFIHIGYPKTASSWLYKKFLKSIKNIKVYDRKIIHQCFMDPGAFNFDAEIVKKSFDKNNVKDIWLSDDILLGRLRLGGAKGFITKELANRLYIVFPDAKIVIFIRNQIDILASAYLQYVKSGGNYSIKKFLYPEKYLAKDANKLVILGIDYFMYDSVIEYYYNLFGKENVYIFLYEDFAEDPKRFIASFASKFKMIYDMNSIDFSLENKGYSSFLLFTRRLCNAFSSNGPLNKYYLINIPKFNYLSRYIHNIANQYIIFGSRPDSIKLLGKKNVNFLKEYYAKSNRRIKDEFGIDGLEKHNYPL